MGGGPGNILIRVGADTAAASRELSNLHGPLGDVQTRGEKMGNAVRKAALPAIGVLGGLAFAAKGAAEAAAEDAASADALAGALERTTGATKAQIAGSESMISALSRSTGIADDELRPALAKLASATGDVGKAQADLRLATDIAATSHKSLETVSKALAAAEDGRTASLGKLVPGLDAATLKSKDMAKITDELSEKVGGAAARAAETATGKYGVMQVQMGELQETLGAALIPVLSKLSEVMLRATDFASQHTGAVKLVIGVVAGLAAGVLVLNAAMTAYNALQVVAKAAAAAWTAGQWLLNAALSANPVGLVIVAVAALAAGVVIAYQRSETFRGAVQAVWGVLRDLNPLNAARAAYDALRGAVGTVEDRVRAFAGAVGNAIDRVSGLRGVLDVLWKVFGYTNPIGILIQHFDSLAGAVSSVVGWIDRIHFPSPPSWLGKVGGLFDAPAPGGAAPAARAYLSRGAAGGAPRTATRSASSSGPFGALASAGQGVTIIVNGATDPEGTARAINRTLRAHRRRQGGLEGALA